MPPTSRIPVRRARPPKATKPAFQEPLIGRQPDSKPEPKPQAKPGSRDAHSREDARPTDHNGIPVVSEELLANLPSGSPFKVTRLHLSDGTKAWGCRDCLFTGDVRRDVQQHRNAEHGAKFGKKTPKLVYAAHADDGDLVLPPRAEGKAAPSDVMQMTVAELLALLPSIGAISDLVDQVEHERDVMRIELVERRKHDRENQHKIDVYDSHQEELLAMRLAMKNTGSYEQMKAELMQLRAWKKRVTAKLNAVGFVLNEED